VRFLLLIFAPFLAGLLALLMLTTWYLAIIYLLAIGLVTFRQIKNHERHNRGFLYDDRADSKTMEEALEEYVSKIRDDTKNSGS